MENNSNLTIFLFVISLWTAFVGWVVKTWHNRLETRINSLEQEIKILPAVDAKLNLLIDMVKDKK